MKLRNLFCAAILSVTAALSASAATTTLTGVVTDDMCGKNHMVPGKSDAECVRMCVKGGARYALLVGDKLYVLSGDTKDIDLFAGKKAMVSGDLNGKTVSVVSITEAK